MKSTAGKRKLRSPESLFIRTGKRVSGLDEKRAERLGTRFLSNAWYRTAQERQREGKLHYPLPTFRQRLVGGRLPKPDRSLIENQINFAIGTFGKHLNSRQKTEAKKQLRKFVSANQISVHSTLRENKKPNLKEMRREGKELYAHLHGKGPLGSPARKGTIFTGIMQEPKGRVYFARGISSDRLEKFVPIHEVIHVLKEIRVIKIDVPFAEAGQRLYALENGLAIDTRIRKPTAAEFDRKARPDPESKGSLLEAGWAYPVGDRIGQWIFQSLPKEKRWGYLYRRCMGQSHAEALKSL